MEDRPPPNPDTGQEGTVGITEEEGSWITVGSRRRPVGGRSSPPKFMSRSGQKNLRSIRDLGRSAPSTHQGTQINKVRPQIRVNKVPATWREVVAGGKSEKRTSLDYFKPVVKGNAVCAEIEQESIERNAGKWSSSLLLYVDNHKPYIGHLQAYIRRESKLKADFVCYSRDNGFFLIKFLQEQDLIEVLENGPWLYDGRLIVMRRWTELVKFDKEVLNAVPVWVRFPGLNLNWWDSKSISKLASVLGTPICLDRATLEQTKINFARVMVEMNASSDFPESVNVLLPNGEIVEQTVTYDYKPERCELCTCFGHSIRSCAKANGKMWKEKNKILENEVVEDRASADKGSDFACSSSSQTSDEQLELAPIVSVDGDICGSGSLYFLEQDSVVFVSTGTIEKSNHLEDREVEEEKESRAHAEINEKNSVILNKEHQGATANKNKNIDQPSVSSSSNSVTTEDKENPNLPQKGCENEVDEVESNEEGYNYSYSNHLRTEDLIYINDRGKFNKKKQVKEGEKGGVSSTSNAGDSFSK